MYTLTLAVVILGVSMGLAYRGCDYIYNYDDGKYRECPVLVFLATTVV